MARIGRAHFALTVLRDDYDRQSIPSAHPPPCEMPWLPWGSSSPPAPPPSPPPPPPQPKTAQEQVDAYTKQLQSRLEDGLLALHSQAQDPAATLAALNARLAQLPPSLLLALGTALGAAGALGTRRAYVRYLKRLPNGDWVTPDVIRSKRWIKGYVTRCSSCPWCSLRRVDG